jgi:hypothetical protein
MVIFHSYVSLPEGTRPMGVPVSAMLEWPGAIYDACRHRPLMSRWLRPDRRGQDGMNRWDRMNRIDHIWHNNIREYSRVGYVYIYIFLAPAHMPVQQIYLSFFFSGDPFCLCQGENPPGPPTPWVSNLSGAKSRRAALGNYHSFMVSSFLFAVVTSHLFHKTSINMYDNAWWYIVHKHDGMSRYNYSSTTISVTIGLREGLRDLWDTHSQNPWVSDQPTLGTFCSRDHIYEASDDGNAAVKKVTHWALGMVTFFWIFHID